MTSALKDAFGSEDTQSSPSVSDEWSTPDDLWKALDRRHHFGVDLAASANNTKCPVFVSKEQNTLTHDWFALWKMNGTLWLNPPYSKPNLPLFMAKARQLGRDGGDIVCLVPASTSEAWFQDNILRGSDVLLMQPRGHQGGPLDGWGVDMQGLDCRIGLFFLRGRLAFGFENGAPTNGAKKGSAIVQFSGRR